METTGSERDARLDHIPLPFHHLGSFLSLDPNKALESDVFGRGQHHSHNSVMRPSADLATIQIGQIKAIALRTTPVVTKEEGAECSTLAMLFAGDKCSYRDGLHSEELEPGDIHLNPRTGGRVDVGYFSGIIYEIDHQALRRTIHAMRGDGSNWNQEKSYVIKHHDQDQALNTTTQFWSFARLVDQLLGECPYLASGMGLDDQLYRLLALSIFQAEGIIDKIEQRWKGRAQNWSSSLDELVDFMRSNAHKSLTMTDLEEQSRYSARHLQNLFRERFNCTPMQFARKQRLNIAMQKLNEASPGVTVTHIARDCGYSHLSTFSSDFKQEFGVTPLSILKAPRGRERERERERDDDAGPTSGGRAVEASPQAGTARDRPRCNGWTALPSMASVEEPHL